MHKFEVYDDVEFINDGVKEVGCIESINEEEGTAVVGLEFHPLESKTFKLSELTYIPLIKVSGKQLKDFFHFDCCTVDQMTGGQWYEFYPDYNIFCTDDEVHITMEDVKQGIAKIEEQDLWESERYKEWRRLLALLFDDILCDSYSLSPNVNLDNDAFDLAEYIMYSVTDNGEYGKDYFFSAADEIQEKRRLEIEMAD